VCVLLIHSKAKIEGKEICSVNLTAPVVASLCSFQKEVYDEELLKLSAQLAITNILNLPEVLKVCSSAEPLPARKAGQPIKYKRVYKLQAFTQLGQSRISSFLPQEEKNQAQLEMNWYCSTRCGIKAVSELVLM